MLAIVLFAIVFTFICVFTHDYNPTVGTVDMSLYPCYDKEAVLQEAALGLYLAMTADGWEL